MTLRPPTPGSVVLVVASGLLLATAAASSLGLAVIELLVAALAITVLHVGVHLATARVFRVPVYTVLLGGGPRLIGAQWGSLAVELRALPVGGTVAYYPDDVEDPEELEDPPAQAVVTMLLAAPLASLALSVLLLGERAAEAIGIIPAQLVALMLDPSGQGLDVARDALRLTQEGPAIVLGVIAAKLGLVQIPANLMLLARAGARMSGREPSSTLLIVTAIVQVVLTTWVLFGFVYALSLALAG